MDISFLKWLGRGWEPAVLTRKGQYLHSMWDDLDELWVDFEDCLIWIGQIDKLSTVEVITDILSLLFPMVSLNTTMVKMWDDTNPQCTKWYPKGNVTYQIGLLHTNLCRCVFLYESQLYGPSFSVCVYRQRDMESARLPTRCTYSLAGMNWLLLPREKVKCNKP